MPGEIIFLDIFPLKKFGERSLLASTDIFLDANLLFVLLESCIFEYLLGSRFLNIRFW